MSARAFSRAVLATASFALLLPPGGALAGDKAARPPAASPDEMAKQAEALVAGGDAAGGLELMRKAAAAPASSADVLLRLGRLLEKNRDLDDAIDTYRSAALRATDAVKGEALGRCAALEEMRGMAAFAETAAAAAAADPTGAWPAVALARLRAREGQGEEAATLARKALAAGGGAEAHAALGRAEEARGDWAAAEAAYRSANAPEGSYATATIGLARVLRRTGRATQAAPLLEAILVAYPGAVDGYKESARVKIALGRGADAFADASTAAALAENDPEAARVVLEASVSRSLGLLAQGQGELAVQDLTTLRDQNPEAAVVHAALGRALAAKRQADPALAALTRAVALDPGLAEAHEQTGYVQQVLKRDAAAAVVAYEKAVASDPARPELRVALGGALVEAKQIDRAVAELGKVTADGTYPRADAWVYLGAAQLAAKRYKEASPALEKALALAPGNAQIEAYLAWCAFGLKDANGFKLHGGKARSLGHKDTTLLQYLTRIEAGEAIK